MQHDFLVTQITQKVSLPEILFITAQMYVCKKTILDKMIVTVF